MARPSEAGAHPELNSPVVPAHTTVVPAEAGTQGRDGARNTAANPARTEPHTTVVPAKAGTQGRGGARNTEANPARTEPVLSSAEGPADSSSVVPAKEPAEGPAPVEPTSAERRIKERLKQHWHEQDPYGAPLDSTHPARPLGGRDPTPQLGGEEVF